MNLHFLNRRSWLAAVCFSVVQVCAADAGTPETPAAFVTALAEKKQTIIAYGTSLTAGGAWVGQLQKALDAKFPGRATIINSGAGGMWSKWGLEHLEERVISKAPDAVLIEWSINDAFLEYQTSPDECRANLNTMLDRILAAHPKCELILQVMNPPTGVHLERRPKIADYEEVYREVAKARKIRLIDHAPQWAAEISKGEASWKTLMPDGIHPNSDGCRKVMMPVLLKALGI